MAVVTTSTTFAASRGTGMKQYVGLDQNPQTIKAASGTLLYVMLDNTNNTTRTYVKFYDSAAPTVGTDDPEVVISAAGGSVFKLEIQEGVAFATAITVAAVTSGGTGGTTPPAAPVTLLAVYS